MTQHKDVGAIQRLSPANAEQLTHFIQRRMTLKQLQVILALQRHKTIANASGSLCMTAANVSLYIREMEQQLQTPLFLRNNGLYRATAAGLLLTQLAQRIDNECQRTIDRCRQAVLHPEAHSLGIGYIGASMSAYAYALWHRLLPQVEGNSLHIEDLSGLLHNSDMQMPRDEQLGIVLSTSPLNMAYDSSEWHIQTFVLRQYHILVDSRSPLSNEPSFLLPRVNATLDAMLHDHILVHYPDHSAISFYNNAMAVMQAGLPDDTALIVSAFEFESIAHQNALQVLDSLQVDHLCYLYVHPRASIIAGLPDALSTLIEMEHAA